MKYIYIIMLMLFTSLISLATVSLASEVSQSKAIFEVA